MMYETSYMIEGYDEKSDVFCFIEDIEKKKKNNGLKSVRSYKKKFLTRELLKIQIMCQESLFT